ncbi:MFS transporter [Afipia sp. Root123D2]|uniref:multidrug effflux MFS transporter n=1 Tax=Afipia sp. Root123D2 TaxID=1736436 RepID=UPI0007017BC4|nr:multidrug effflux MFS transporter [Afipia sp. Root123D2]KQW22076.1 MFS transporter [Afipia sp. Root123D2]
MTDPKAKVAIADLAATPWKILPLLVAMNGIAPVSLYMLVPMLPLLATTFQQDISVAQMTVSLYMVGLACSQLVMGPLSDRYGRRPVLMCCLGLVVVANIGCIFAETLPQLIVGRFLQAVGGAAGMVISRAIVRDIYERNRIGGMISLVIAVMMIAQMISPLVGGLLDYWFGWRSIFYVLAVVTTLTVVAIMLALPETRRFETKTNTAGFLKDVRALSSSKMFLGYVLCQMFASAIIFVFAGGGPYIVVDHMNRSTTEYGMWFATAGFAYMMGNFASVRLSPRHGLDRMIVIGLMLQIVGSILNVAWGIAGLNQLPAWLFGTHMIVMFGNAFAMSNASAGAISVRPQAAGTASGAMGFLQMGFGSLCSQLGASLGGHFATPLAMNIAMLMLSLACAAAILFLVPRRSIPVTAEKMIEAEEQETGLL